MSPDLHSLSGAYALDALDADERTAFEEHLRVCEACRDEVASFAEVTPLLAAGDEVAPPPSLRDRVLADARTIRQDPPLPRGSTAREPLAATPSTDPGSGGDDTAGRDDTAPASEGDSSGTARSDRSDADADNEGAPVTRLRPRARTVVAALAAAAALVLGGGVAWQAVRDDSTVEQTTLAQRVLDAPDATESETQVSGGGTITLVRSESLGQMAVVGHDLPDTDEDHGYQAWMQDDQGAMHPSSMIPVDGTPTVLSGDATGMTGVGVTVEPDGGSTEPTTEPVALIEL